MAKAKMKSEEQRLREQISELTAEAARLKAASDEAKTPSAYRQWASAAGFLQSCRERLVGIHEQQRAKAAAAARQQRMEQLRPKAQAANALSLALSEALSDFADSGGGVAKISFSDPNRRLLTLGAAVIETDTGFEIRSQHPVTELRERFLKTS